jgi:hypothetical protein
VIVPTFPSALEGSVGMVTVASAINTWCHKFKLLYVLPHSPNPTAFGLSPAASDLPGRQKNPPLCV